MTVTEQQEDQAADTVARDLTLYTLARVGIVVVVAGILVLVKIPLLVALAIALVAGFPLGLLLFSGLNKRLTTGLAARGARRTEERDRLRAQLRGDE